MYSKEMYIKAITMYTYTHGAVLGVMAEGQSVEQGYLGPARPTF